MSLMKSKSKPVYRWQQGDLITASEASGLLGYKSGKKFQDRERLKGLIKEFEAVGCVLTIGLEVGGGQRFLRSEIDLFISRKLENVEKFNRQNNNNLSLSK